MGARLGVWLMHRMARWPLPLLRALATVVGLALYALAVPRRRVVMANLRVCFPAAAPRWRRQIACRTFVHFAQAWFDRAWLWHAPPELTCSRLTLSGEPDALRAPGPIVLFAPHFYGLDAGWTALCGQVQRHFLSIYTPQPDPTVDAWIREGRERLGDVALYFRGDGPRPVANALRQGHVLYLLPDMNFGPQESIFVPFYGVQAATVPSLSRFARLAKARVMPVTTRLIPAGYEVRVHPAWEDYPTADAEADTARMNRELEQLIATMPSQYYWVHKRFKTRPPGEASIY